MTTDTKKQVFAVAVVTPTDNEGGASKRERCDQLIRDASSDFDAEFREIPNHGLVSYFSRAISAVEFAFRFDEATKSPSWSSEIVNLVPAYEVHIDVEDGTTVTLVTSSEEHSVFVSDRAFELFMVHCKELYTADKSEELLDLSQSLFDIESLSVGQRAQCEDWIGGAHWLMGEYEIALEYLGGAFKLAEKAQDLAWQARITGHMGDVCIEMGDDNKAIGHYEDALKIERQLDDKSLAANRLTRIADSCQTVYEMDKALSCQQEALEIQRERGSSIEVIRGLGRLGWIECKRGEHDKAFELYEEALGMARELEDSTPEGSVLCNMGVLFDNKGDFSKALEYYERSTEIYRKLEVPQGLGACLSNMGQSHIALEDYDKALKLLEEALSIQTEYGLWEHQANTTLNLAVCHLETGDIAKAREEAQRGAEDYKSLGMGNTPPYILPLVMLARCDEADGNIESAKEWGSKALEFAKSIDLQEKQTTDELRRFLEHAQRIVDL